MIHAEYCLSCDGCNEFWPDDGNADMGTRERRRKARSDGWTQRRAEDGTMMDLCPECSRKERGEQ